MTYAEDRHALRQLIRGGRSMDYADWARRMGLISDFVHARFLRLWAWSTATEHPLTAGVPLARWGERRARIRLALGRLKARGVL